MDFYTMPFLGDSDEAATLRVSALEAQGLPYRLRFRELDGVLVEVLVEPPEIPGDHRMAQR